VLIALLKRGIAPVMTRPSEYTRRNILDAATKIFAERGYGNASVREITKKAGANQAAITYHFGGKGGLYREVLKMAFAAFNELFTLDPLEIERMSGEEAVRIFLHQQFSSLRRRNGFGRFLKIFSWETVNRSEVFESYVAIEPLPIFALAQAIVRKFLPSTSNSETVLLVSVWFVQQATIFIRDFERLSRPPLNLAVDDHFVDRLIGLITQLLLSGLNGTADGAPGAAELVRN
jgi:AcrR family transcriptional regulator